MASLVRVTLGIATYNRDTYLAQAIRSGLSQDYPDLEVLVVVDGATNPRIGEVLAQFEAEERLRVIRHPTNLGIAAAYNTFVSEGKGELIAMIGDDDLCLPGRIRRQVEIFERHPDTGVVHGDATVIDASGRQTGLWNSAEFTPAALLQAFYFSHNHLVDPTRMVHRRVYEAIGGYDDRYPVANDFDFWLRACREFRFRHCPGGPLSAIRRHGENTSDERTGRAAELADVEGILSDGLERFDLRELVPGLDWAVLDPQDAERQALHRLADGLERRLFPVPGLAATLRARAEALERDSRRPARKPAAKGKLMVTAFGWNDSGGGTTVPRLAAKELARRGWEVTVFHAAVNPTEARLAYEQREWTQDGVRLIGIHNRPHGLFDLGNPERELDDPPITHAFADALDRFRPDVVHFHNLHNLGAALIDEAAVRGLPSYFTTHNYWLMCPRAYLLTGEGSICSGPGDGTRCASCTGGYDEAGHRRRLAEIRARAESGLRAVLCVSDAVRQALLGAGYDPALLDVVRQAMPHEQEIWAQVGAQRAPGRRAERLTVAFLGSAYPHKGPQLLVQAAQQASAAINVRILGEVPERFAAQLRELDQRGLVELHGAFAPSEIGALLRDVDAVALPSMWWDCAPLAAAECLAARVPLIVPRLGGLPESIRDGVDGLSFDGLDAGDLARVLDCLALEEGLLERLQGQIEPPRAFADYVDQLESYYAGGRTGAVTAPPAPEQIAVRWQGDHGLSTSLSIINDSVTARLPGPVERVRTDGTSASPPLPHPAAVEVRHQWPPDFRQAGSGALAAIVPWEFGAAPRDWVTQIQTAVDELWVPSEYVRQMYVTSGVEPDRVQVIPNGVDLELFTPDPPAGRAGDARTRFLFVGGLIWRKGPDVLLDAFRRAFPGRDDVVLVIKDFGADGVYRSADRAQFHAYAQSGELPALELIQADLAAPELAALYRSSDVLVHPYRGEGFAMPVLEAMACGLPVIATGGGPTDEFCPPGAGWRIRSRRAEFPEDRVDAFETTGRPWVLEPDVEHLAELLRAAAADKAGRRERGLAAREAALELSWDAVAARYLERIVALAGSARGRPSEPFPFEVDAAVKLLATPAWKGADRLGELLRDWCDATTRTTSACLYLLADPAVAGTPEEIEAHVVAAAAGAGADLDSCADIEVLLEPMRADRDERLHASVEAFVTLHAGAGGHARRAWRIGLRVLEPGTDELRSFLAAIPSPAPPACVPAAAS